MLNGKQLALFSMVDFVTRAFPCKISMLITLFLQTIQDTLFSLYILPFLLLRHVLATLALQDATALVIVLQLHCVELLAAKCPTAMSACVRTHIVRMVAFLSTGFAH